MRNHSFLVLVLLLFVGVFGVNTDGVKSVSVMEGDSVTLHTGLTEIQRDGDLRWKFQDKIIARIDRESNKITAPGNTSFEGRLKLNEATGSLTITNIKTTDARVYELQISSKNLDGKKEFSVSVYGVFGVNTDGVKSVSMMQGDSVTLHTGLTEIQTNDQILWRFGDQGDTIARLNSAVYKWSNIDLNKQTGDLNIRNIPKNQAGVYEVEINTGSVILHRKFRITISGVFSVDGVKKMSKRKGESVILHTEITDIPDDDVIEWTFGPQDTALAKTDRQEKKIIYNKGDVTFKDRLKLETKSGDLIVNNFKPEMSGLYKVKIIKSTYTLQKTFSVTLKVTDSRGASGFTGSGVPVICAASVVLACAVAVFLLQGV